MMNLEVYYKLVGLINKLKKRYKDDTMFEEAAEQFKMLLDEPESSKRKGLCSLIKGDVINIPSHNHFYIVSEEIEDSVFVCLQLSTKPQFMSVEFTNRQGKKLYITTGILYIPTSYLKSRNIRYSHTEPKEVVEKAQILYYNLTQLNPIKK